MKLIFAAIALLMVGCSQAPYMVSGDVKELESASLYGVGGVSFDKFYVSNLDTLARYNAVQFENLSFDNLVVDSRRLDFRQRDWEFEDREKDRFKKYFSKKVNAVFNNSDGLRLVDQPGEGVLTVNFELVEFVPNAPKDDALGRPFRQKILTRGVGDLSVKAKIVDSLTGEVLALLEDEEEVGDTGFLEINDKVNNTRHIKNTMESWIRTFKNTMESLKTVS